jgi:hypothetical protein
MLCPRTRIPTLDIYMCVCVHIGKVYVYLCARGIPIDLWHPQVASTSRILYPSWVASAGTSTSLVLTSWVWVCKPYTHRF